MKFLNFFDMYVAIGLKPIALYKHSKTPIAKGWSHNWSVNKWRPFFKTPKFNMGILLGDIVDVEGDSPQANKIIEQLIGSVAHPKFSSSKSIHHLFKTPDPSLTRISYQGIEFRGKNHQSVVPPSLHESEIKYQWIEGSVFEIPEMPIDLVRYYVKIKSIQENKKPTLVVKKSFFSTVCKSCEKTIKIDKKRLILEVKAFREHNLPWACQKCRKIDIRPLCRKLKRKAIK